MANLHLLRSRPTDEQILEMLEAHGDFIKLAVDIRQRIAVGGGGFHADCEEVLTDNGTRGDDIWGADYEPAGKLVTFEALINIRSVRNNPSMEILDPKICATVEAIVREKFEG